MKFGVFSLYFLLLEQKKKLIVERLSFKTQLKVELLWLYTRHKKKLENIYAE